MGGSFGDLLLQLTQFGQQASFSHDGTELRELVLEVLRRSEGSEESRALFQAADRVRHQHMGDTVHLRGVIEFSNYCKNDCLYCGLRASNGSLQRYRMPPEEIVAVAVSAIETGFRTIVLQSGEDPWYSAQTLAAIITRIKEQASKRGIRVAITLSLGERSPEELALLRQAGADRYLLKHETSDEKLHAQLRPGHTLHQRLQCIHTLRQLGYQVGSGNIVGLPGQTIESIADDLVLLKKLDVEMAGIGPFVPHPNTPLGGHPAGSLSLVLRTLAVARILMPWCHLPATTALATLAPGGRQMGLQCGANVVMPALTPARYARHYQIYPGKELNAMEVTKAWESMKELVHALGRTVDSSPGHSPKPGPWNAEDRAPGVASLSATPRGERLHIAVFGRRNAGKSSLINALAGQPVALVSDVPGTTTDPVYKTMEILPIGPTVLIDTAGIDDVGELGQLRVKRTMDVLRSVDLPILALDPTVGLGEYELSIAETVKAKGLPLLVVVTKADVLRLSEQAIQAISQQTGAPVVEVSSATGWGLDRLKQKIVELCPEGFEGPPLVRDLLQPGDTVVLVVPIDLEAPKGRLILPQVQVLRDVLDANAVATVTKEDRLAQVLASLSAARVSPRLVVTDSQAFGVVSQVVPEDIWLTSFSILFARHKGDLRTLVEGAKAVEMLRPGDKVLVAEACTHHPIGDDIGRKKIPAWLQKRVGGELRFTWCAGKNFPSDLNEYKLVIHCGACMLNRKEMLYRMNTVREAGLPIVNYGVLIAYLHGILDRAVRPFRQVSQ